MDVTELQKQAEKLELRVRVAALPGTFVAPGRTLGDSKSYLTIDRWRSAAAFVDFLRVNEEAYAALDAECESLTTDEECIGTFSVVQYVQN
ncbi:MAG TPA: hypothetical protein VKZ91_11745 [Woeseiaceae bacterium]|nr:hypothetical protein [Woeseiaceae bacterium]